MTNQLLKSILDQLMHISNQLDNIASMQKNIAVSESKTKKMAQKQMLSESLAKKRKKMHVKQAIDNIIAEKIF